MTNKDHANKKMLVCRQAVLPKGNIGRRNLHRL